MNIKIDPEFASLIPPLSDEEFKRLEESILNEGCRDAIVVWEQPKGFGNADIDNEADPYMLHEIPVIVDGHNRYKICTEHNIPFRVEYADLEDKEDVKLWMMNNQLARRNLTDLQRIEMVHACEDAVKAKAKKRQGTRTDINIVENFPQCKARDELGSMVGVSGKTYERGVKILKEAPEPVVDAVRRDKLSINAGYEVTKMSDFQKMEIAHRIEHIEDEPEETNTPKKIVQEVAKRPHVSFNSGNNEWYTPAPIIDAARDTMGSITLDPASNEMANATVRANRYYTYEDNGLEQEWFGNVWLNPPYASDLIGKFVDKTVAERRNYKQAIVLVNNATETGWFLKLVSIASAICFPYSRVKYYMPNGKTGAPLQGQAIIYIGDDVDAFSDEFESIGWIARDLYGIYE